MLDYMSVVCPFFICLMPSRMLCFATLDEILLSHRNNHYEQYTQARVDLTLAGHAHGGLIRLPGTDGLVGPKRELFPQYTAGLYDLSYGQMVVSRGLGNQFPCFRLLNRPDVPLVVLG